MQFLVEGGGGRELRNTFGKVAESVSLAGYCLSDPGHEVRQIKVPEIFEGCWGWSEL